MSPETFIILGEYGLVNSWRYDLAMYKRRKYEKHKDADHTEANAASNKHFISFQCFFSGLIIDGKNGLSQDFLIEWAPIRRETPFCRRIYRLFNRFVERLSKTAAHVGVFISRILINQ